MGELNFKESVDKFLEAYKNGKLKKVTPEIIAEAKRKLGIDPAPGTPTNLKKRKRFNPLVKVNIYNNATRI